MPSHLRHRRIRSCYGYEVIPTIDPIFYSGGSQAPDRAGLSLWLPGTGARGSASDYDLALLFSEEPSAQERYTLGHQLAQLLETDRVDLVVLNRAPIELRYGVIATGYLLYEASRAWRVEFEAQTLSRYFDYLPILRCQRKELLEEE